MSVRIRVRAIGWVFAAVAAALLALPGSRAQAEEITFKALTPWTPNFLYSKPLLMFADRVNEQLPGKLHIKYLGYSDVVPTSEQFEAVRNGVVDTVLSATSYFRGQLPIAGMTQLTMVRKSVMRKNGFFDAMRQVYKERVNLIYVAEFGGMPGGDQRYYLVKKITTPEGFKGLKMRTAALYVPHLKSLGAVPINMAPSEMYTALERGVVDGLGWGRVGIMNFALQEVTKFVVDHPVYTSNTPILINLKSWNRLPADVQGKIDQIGAQLETDVEEMLAAAYLVEDVKLKEAGLEFIRFDKKGEEMFNRLAYESGWAEFEKHDAALVKKLRHLIE